MFAMRCGPTNLSPLLAYVANDTSIRHGGRVKANCELMMLWSAIDAAHWLGDVLMSEHKTRA